MSRFDPARDPLLGEVLRRMTPKSVGARQLDALAARIRAGAAPLLDARRRETQGWSEYVAHWAGALVPLGVLTALAAGLCLAWLTRQQQASADVAVERAAILGAATSGSTSADLLDLAIVESPLPPAPKARR